MPTILDHTGTPFASEAAKPARTIRAKFDSAQTTADNRKHWQNADGLSADAAATPAIRRVLRNRARYETQNNSYGKGIVQTLVNDIVGTGPRLQMLTDDDALNSEVEDAWEEWAETICLAAKLHTLRFSRCIDGEAFAVLGYNPENANIGSDILLDLRLIEAEQVAAAPGAMDPADGIAFDPWGNPSTFRVLKTHPGSAGATQDFASVPAAQMIHTFCQYRPGQSRGIPEITPALPLFAQLRRYTLAVIEAAEVAADHAAVLQTNAPAGEQAADAEAFEEITLESRMATILPAGWTLGQMKSEQPTTTYPAFKKEILNEIARCLNMSYNVAAGNSSGYNYSSGRLDWQTYYRAIRIDQSFMEKKVLVKLFAAWRREWALVSGRSALANTRLKHKWFWDGQEHVDPSKEANAQETRLQNNTTTLADEYARVGKDWEPALEQRFREKARAMALAKKYGVPYEDPHAAPTGQPTPTDQPDDGDMPPAPEE
jgi:lambda family phage portal protein